MNGAGKNARIAIAIRNVASHGIISLVYSPSEQSMMEFTVYIDSPTGGVQLPIVTTVQIIMPK